MAAFIRRTFAVDTSSSCVRVLAVSATVAVTWVAFRFIRRLRHRGLTMLDVGQQPCEFVARRGHARAPSIGLTTVMCSNAFDVPGGFQPIISVRLRVRHEARTQDQQHSRLPAWDAAHPERSGLGDFLARITQHHRFRSVPAQVEAGGDVDWVSQRVDLAAHVHCHRIGPSGAATATLRQLEEDVVNRPLADPNRPWWEVHVIHDPPPEGDEPDGDTVIVILRIHHAIGDGVSLADACLEALVSGADGATVLSLASIFKPRARGGGRRARRRSLLKGAWRALVVRPVCFLGNCMYAAGAFQYPRDGTNVFNDSARTTHPPVATQALVYLPSCRLDLLKAIRMAADPSGAITINDVAFALLGGALRRFAIRTTGSVPARLRSMTPFAIPLLKPLPALSRYNATVRNYFSFILNDFPVRSESPLERLRAAAATWRATKQSTVVPATMLMTAVAGAVLPLWVRQAIARGLQRHNSILFSNVPGPQEPVGFPGWPGARIATAHILCPNINPYIGLFSLDGAVHIAGSFHIDGAGVAPHMAPAEARRQFEQELPKDFALELAELAAAVGVDPDAFSARAERTARGESVAESTAAAQA